MSRDYDEHFECPDDRHCINCGEELPSNPDEDTPAFDGVCNEECRSKARLKYFVANGGKINFLPPTISFIRICPTLQLDEEYKPVLDIYWNDDTKQVDTRYEGPVSDGAKLLVDNFAEQLYQYFKERLKEELQ